MFPPSVQEWLPDDHLARFIADLVGKLDLRSLRARYAGRGVAAYQPEMLVALLFYGYATGIFSSRKLERATYDSVAFRYIAANQHPEHDTIATFRRRFLPEVKDCFRQILLIAAESGMLKVGRVSIDGTKIKANASKHHALSYAHATKLERRIKNEIERLLRTAEKADVGDVPDGMDIPAELARREIRLQAIDEAKERIRIREQERIAAEQAAYEKKLTERAGRERENGKKHSGSKPKRPSRVMNPNAQINLSDSESRVMPTGDGFVQGYNAQAVVDCGSLLLVDVDVSQRPTDVTLLESAVTHLTDLPEQLGVVNELLADAGYYSAGNVEICERHRITPYISVGRERHAGGLTRFREPPRLRAGATPKEQMQHRLRTKDGRAIYGQRKATIEPRFGNIKSIHGFRQFSLRGHDNVSGEWQIMGSAYNLKRMHTIFLNAKKGG
ncbi:MAG TPA: IS1182 family transposase [Candidatus Baltobacteraceae bacterium]|nr:IS1182 family transposase [Candidatus Baltobacteraceae bacterium]